MEDVTVPDYYQKFKCIGPRCEDTCCSGGWNVSIDRETYYKYKQNRHKELAPIFKIALVKNTTPSANSGNNFGLLKMKPDGQCHFQQPTGLCAIHCTLGPQGLSDTCRIYPRYLNQFGDQRENSLGISCPEAARLILLHAEPIQFDVARADPDLDKQGFTSYRFPLGGDGDPRQIAVLNDFRALIIAILQWREVPIGARVMLLGFLLDDAEKVTASPAFADAQELVPTLSAFASMLSKPEQVTGQFGQIEAQLARQLESITGLISQSLMVGAAPRLMECLVAAVQGLEAGSDKAMLDKYRQSFQQLYLPYFGERSHVFENYLVNQVITRLFPFTRGSYLALYREMVFNLAIVRVLLVGMAARHGGLTDELVIQLFQSFARKSDHNRGYLDRLGTSLQAQEGDSFIHLMWLLQEPH